MESLGRVGLELKYGFMLAPVMVVAAYWAASSVPKRWASTFALWGVLTGLFGIVLVGMWSSGVSDGSVFAGILPSSDAGGYYSDAVRLWHGEAFTAYSTRRPLFPGMLAVFVAATRNNLRVVLLALSALGALSMVLAARTIQVSFGRTVACAFVVILFLFYRRYVGTTLTEHLGLTLGCLSFALLWDGVRTHNRWLVLLGLVAQVLGLCARAGAFGVLLSLSVWGAWAFRTRRRASCALFLCCCILCVVAGFSVNGALLHVLGVQGEGYSNFAHTLYGLVFGGDWHLALKDHPELAGVSQLEQSRAIYGLAFGRIRSQPSALLVGSLRALAAFFLSPKDSVFTLVAIPTLEARLALSSFQTFGWRATFDLLFSSWRFCNVLAMLCWILLLNVLGALGLFGLFRLARERLCQLVVVVWLGVLLSVPFVPPWDAGSMRAYAVSIPFIVSITAIGIEQLRRLTRSPLGFRRSAETCGQRLLLGFTVCVLVLMTVGPAVLRYCPRRSRSVIPQTNAMCDLWEQPAVVELYSSASVRICDSSSQATFAGCVALPSLRRSLEHLRFVEPDLARELTTVREGTGIATTYNVLTHETRYALMATSHMHMTTEPVLLCGKSGQYWFVTTKATVLGSKPD